MMTNEKITEIITRTAEFHREYNPVRGHPRRHAADLHAVELKSNGVHACDQTQGIGHENST